MLRIDIPSTSEATLNQGIFDEYSLPKPENGTDTEINGDLILQFEDEEDAVTYLDTLEDFASELDNDSAARQISNALITAINNDEFVQAYLA